MEKMRRDGKDDDDNQKSSDKKLIADNVSTNDNEMDSAHENSDDLNNVDDDDNAGNINDNGITTSLAMEQQQKDNTDVNNNNKDSSKMTADTNTSVTSMSSSSISTQGIHPPSSTLGKFPPPPSFTAPSTTMGVLASPSAIPAFTTSTNPNSNSPNSNHSRHILPYLPRRIKTTKSKHSSKKKKPPSRRQLYNRQLQLLGALTGGSFGLFLLFFLNLFAFSLLMATLILLSLFFYTSYSYLQYLYENGELTLYPYLPSSIQEYLTSTSIHDYMTDDSPSTLYRYRYLMMYYLPGLSEEQLTVLIGRLPPRHREALMRPGGIPRLVLPESVLELLMPARSHSGRGFSYSANGGVSTLPAVPEERMGDDGEDYDEDGEGEVTIQEAMSSLIHVASSLLQNHGTPEDSHGALLTRESPQQHPPLENDLTWEDDEQEEEDDIRHVEHENRQRGEAPPIPAEATSGERPPPTDYDDDSSRDADSDLGLDITENDLIGGGNEGQLMRIARFLGLYHPRPNINTMPQQQQEEENETSTNEEFPSPPTTVTAQLSSVVPPDAWQRQQEQEEEDDNNIQGQVFDDAVSTMVQNFVGSATSAITTTTNTIVESVAPTIIRSGTMLASVSGMGLLGYYSSLHGYIRPVGILGRTIGTGVQSRTASPREQRFVTLGLVSTMVMGGATAGIMIYVRNRVRNTVTLAQNNDLELLTSVDDEDEKIVEGEKEETKKDL